MQTTEKITSALTAQLEPSTKAKPPSIGELSLGAEIQWAAWLRLETRGDAQLRLLVAKCAAFALAVKEGGEPRWLTILGPSGTGKTHCARRLWQSLHGRFSWDRMDFIAALIYWPAFMSELRSGGAYNREREMQRWPMLCLDDIGAERDTSGFASEHLNALMGCRVGRWTIITSNLSLEQIGSIDPRIADRMIREPNMMIELSVSSYAMR
jgi:DNA replication protein DnaC